MSDVSDIETSVAKGRAVRKTLPRSGLGEWRLRDRDPVAILRAQDEQRLTDLVPIRYGRMLVSPFTFYRGAAAIMAADLGSQPDTGLLSQICGDAHLMNFGGYASPERAFIFDVNDFDETHIGPFEWDLKRLLTSFIIAAQERGMSPSNQLRPATAAAAAYRRAMESFAQRSRLDVWYSRLDEYGIIEHWEPIMGKKATQEFRCQVERSRRKTSQRAARKMTKHVGNRFEFESNPPLLTPMRELLSADDYAYMMDQVSRGWDLYVQTLQSNRRHLVDGYRFVDIARKVVGVGSVGTRCYVALMVGARGDRDPLVLQLKEAVSSVLHPYAPAQGAHGNHGRRVVEGQRLMQAASDIFLGWTKVIELDGAERDFYVRQLWDWKQSADLPALPNRALVGYAEMCGWTLARAHARSGDRYALAAYLGRKDSVDRALVAWAQKYTAQNFADFLRVKEAASNGDIPYEAPPEAT